MENSTNEMLETEIERLREAFVLSQTVSDSIERETRRYPKQLNGGEDE